jgi:hypothetical protein
MAITIEKTTEGLLELPAKPFTALVRIKQVELAFSGKPRNEDVKV